ncbi:hypothetical protein [Candidatus Nitrosotalea bavarica]|uniref:hypothetical protein n=1 Tax=Candidatus Nitrosotalea bavarica TaxID=1903277 RepID=UPI001056DCAB|nr:hypothetical protein [Candidatus Nitrosotalea bavarica]
MAQRIKQANPYAQILSLDTDIRFVGRIKDRKLITFVRKANASPLLDEELSNMVHYQASVKASWDEMFNEKLGRTNWMITSKEKIKLITLFLNDGLLILSTAPDSNHDEIITKIKNLNSPL